VLVRNLSDSRERVPPRWFLVDVGVGYVFPDPIPLFFSGLESPVFRHGALRIKFVRASEDSPVLWRLHANESTVDPQELTLLERTDGFQHRFWEMLLQPSPLHDETLTCLSSQERGESQQLRAFQSYRKIRASIALGAECRMIYFKADNVNGLLKATVVRDEGDRLSSQQVGSLELVRLLSVYFDRFSTDTLSEAVRRLNTYGDVSPGVLGQLVTSTERKTAVLSDDLTNLSPLSGVRLNLPLLPPRPELGWPTTLPFANQSQAELLKTQWRARLGARLSRLYGLSHAQTIQSLLDSLLGLIAKWAGPLTTEAGFLGLVSGALTQKDAILIAYGDHLHATRPAPAAARPLGESDQPSPLRVLAEWCREHMQGCVSTIHVLPFHPSTSYQGYAISDYLAFDPEIGPSWLVSKKRGLIHMVLF
jgi:hypothetical protein